ncbi:3-dehydroquinate dehydratase [Sulfurimonas paralvinellae]|uniref:3-dehydroquinate dehydratase n=1 Tax=Sulfurimonas paralvinellae TaxID=317658 RepID=A0A7M1B9X8_9BACT|nr:3-dehydroquinate dehydratase [Sulfurimonas paralvinellae]QOP46503.1 3-dehydroquinate dehydratase [Sulfurimonas paralvinellae]
MKALTRGLYALVLTLFIHSPLLATEYLYKDELIHNAKFTQEINTLGTILYEKTGIALRLVMLKKLPDGMNMYQYENQILKTMNEPTILLTFSELNQQIDIEANDSSLYKYFNKKQVLSPVTSYVQAFMMGVFYAKSWDEFKSMMTNVDGTILPLLGEKAKKPKEKLAKYSAAMFNGYLDIAQQIAKAKGVKLGEEYDSTANQSSLFYVKLFFYGFVLYGTIMYIKRRIYKKRHQNEHN